jgi:hypothetical protein
MKRIVAILGVAATFAGEVRTGGDLVTFNAWMLDRIFHRTLRGKCRVGLL